MRTNFKGLSGHRVHNHNLVKLTDMEFTQMTNVNVIIPTHNRAEMLRSANSSLHNYTFTKFHDYLAMGKPVVTTNIGGAEALKDVVRIADTPAAFLSQIEAALADDSPDFIQQRKKVAFENSWPNRIKEVEKVLISRLPQGR